MTYKLYRYRIPGIRRTSIGEVFLPKKTRSKNYILEHNFSFRTKPIKNVNNLSKKKEDKNGLYFPMERHLQGCSKGLKYSFSFLN